MKLHSAKMNKAEFIFIIILRFVGISGLFAVPAIFLPYSWMNVFHGWMGLGTMPDAPVVDYLARSLSMFYAFVSAITLYISYDIWRYRSLLKLMTILGIVMGTLLLGIDLAAGMPTSWTLCEGPPIIAIGLFALWLQRHIGAGPDRRSD